jgi:hypothetical protein
MVDAVLVLSLGTIVVVLVLQVALRYLVSAPLPWPEELSQFLLVGVSFFGMYRAFREDAHIRIAWLPKRPLPCGCFGRLGSSVSRSSWSTSLRRIPAFHKRLAAALCGAAHTHGHPLFDDPRYPARFR